MCGIAGWVDFRTDLSDQHETIDRMTDTMRLRGPDAVGHYYSPHALLGHRRLSIIDLDGGTQPMIGKRNGTDVVLIYTGEVYNFVELRQELRERGHSFETRSDTEVVLAAYLEWGAACVERFNGMFAFAIWDQWAKELLLVRDRVGIKPLYYHPYPGGVLFGSEPKAIMANTLFRPRLDHSALPILLQPRLALPGQTPLKDLHEVRPGHVIRFDMSGFRETQYWKLQSRPHELDFASTAAEVRELLEDIVNKQMVADVPRSAMLSGGLDSTAVAALAARVEGSSSTLETFCVEFESDTDHFSPTELRPEIDAPYARKAADFIGTDHRSFRLNSADILATLPNTRRSRDLPGWGSFDASMYYLFGEIRKHCTVALSGEAADEVFGGYPWFFKDDLIHRDTFPWLGEAPRVSDCLSADMLQQINPAEDEHDRYATLRAQVPTLPGEDPVNARMRETLYFSMSGPLAILLDRKDRMSMAHGLEVRVPYCDHRLIEYLWNVPWDMKAMGGMKGLLKEAVRDLVPDSTLSRKKSGYPGMHDPEFDRKLLARVDWIVNDPESELRDLFDAKRINNLIESCGKSTTWINAAHMLIPLVETSEWVREYGVAV